eukprot:jgi/Mesen1/3754/ME000205S03014
MAATSLSQSFASFVACERSRTGLGARQSKNASCRSQAAGSRLLVRSPDERIHAKSSSNFFGTCKLSPFMFVQEHKSAQTASKNYQPRRHVGVNAAASTDGGNASLPEALLFDCDGVLVDTERDGHRISFNQAFQEKGLDVTWDVELYGELLKIGGGKERMTHYFNEQGWPANAPAGDAERKDFVAGLHKQKTALFMDLVETGALPLRPGVARLVDEALASGVKVAVCSTSNEKAVSAIVRVMLGSERAAQILIFAGDVVPKKKPDPAIYTLAATTLGVDPSRCVVVEDSHIGLTAAKAAGMTCVVTKSGYTADEDFGKADAVYEEIGDAPAEKFGLATLATLAARQIAAA